MDASLNRPLSSCLPEPRKPVHEMLAEAGLRPTRQRIALGELLFRGGDRHVTAERLFDEAVAARLSVSLATVYNTLHQFTDAGLLREIAVDGARVYFDTNVNDHHHFLVEDDGELHDIPGAHVTITDLPTPPSGLRIDRVDVVVRLRRDEGGTAEPDSTSAERALALTPPFRPDRRPRDFPAA